MRKDGCKVIPADNDVLSGIVTTATRLSNRDILIGDCQRLRDELQSYVWDEDAQSRGEDCQIKEFDHCADAIRYWAHSTGKLHRSIGNLKVS